MKNVKIKRERDVFLLFLRKSHNPQIGDSSQKPGTGCPRGLERAREWAPTWSADLSSRDGTQRAFSSIPQGAHGKAHGRARAHRAPATRKADLRSLPVSFLWSLHRLSPLEDQFQHRALGFSHFSKSPSFSASPFPCGSPFISHLLSKFSV